MSHCALRPFENDWNENRPGRRIAFAPHRHAIGIVLLVVAAFAWALIEAGGTSSSSNLPVFLAFLLIAPVAVAYSFKARRVAPSHLTARQHWLGSLGQSWWRRSCFSCWQASLILCSFYEAHLADPCKNPLGSATVYLIGRGSSGDGRNPRWGWLWFLRVFPRVARSEPDWPTSQPWALWRNPVGIRADRDPN